jgi:hypothetical protein
VLFPAMVWSSPIDPGSSTANWMDIFCLSNSPDPSGDQGPVDLEGDAIRAALATNFDDGSMQLDGENGLIARRMRVSGDRNSAVFENFIAINLDTREDARSDIDLYLYIDDQGASDRFALNEQVAQVTTLPDYRAVDEGMGFLFMLDTDDQPNAPNRRGSGAHLERSHAIPSNALGVISTPTPRQTGAAPRSAWARDR